MLTRTEHELMAMYLWGWPAWFASEFCKRLFADRKARPKDCFWDAYVWAEHVRGDDVNVVLCPKGWEL